MDYVKPLLNSQFVKLWSAQILSVLSQNLLNFALIILVYDLAAPTRFGNVSVALVVLSFGLPALLFAPLAGSLADHWDRKRIMLASNLLRALLIPLYIVFSDNLWLILALTFLIATITQFFIPAEAATIPRVVPGRYLLAANSLFVFSFYSSFVLGYSFSGPVVAFLGANGLYYLTAGMMALATLLIAFVPRQPITHPAKVHFNLVHQLRENVRVVKRFTGAKLAITQITLVQSILFIALALAPALSQELLGRSLLQASHILVIPASLGLVVGVVAVNYIGNRISRGTIMATGIAVGALVLAAIGAIGVAKQAGFIDTLIRPDLLPEVLAVLMLTMGTVNAMVTASAQTLLQEVSADEARGKLFSALTMYVSIAATVPTLVVGLLADIVSPPKVMTIIGLMLLVYVVISAYRHRRLTRDNLVQL